MEFESGATANMTMNAFTENMSRSLNVHNNKSPMSYRDYEGIFANLASFRWTRICGTKGELRWDGSARNAIEVHDFATGEKRLVYPDSIGRMSDFDTTVKIFNPFVLFLIK